MRNAYLIGADDYYSVDVTLDLKALSYADVMLYGSKLAPAYHSFSSANPYELLSMILMDMDKYHVKIANILQFKAEYRKHVVDLQRAEKPHTVKRKGSIMSKFDKYNSGAPFMNGRTKRDIKELYGTPMHIDEHAFLQGANGEFAVFTVQGDDTAFFFANSVVTELFKRIDADGLDLREAEIVFSSKKSKNWGTDYTTYSIS